MPLKVYTYEKCDTCRKAVRFLKEHGLQHEIVPIRERPPTPAELKTMLRHVGDIRRLFNTGGRDYKELGLAQKLPGLSQEQAINLLARNGNLVKRPFALGKDIGLIGFKESDWQEKLA